MLLNFLLENQDKITRIQKEMHAEQDEIRDNFADTKKYPFAF